MFSQCHIDKGRRKLPTYLTDIISTGVDVDYILVR